MKHVERPPHGAPTWHTSCCVRQYIANIDLLYIQCSSYITNCRQQDDGNRCVQLCNMSWKAVDQCAKTGITLNSLLGSINNIIYRYEFI